MDPARTPTRGAYFVAARRRRFRAKPNPIMNTHDDSFFADTFDPRREARDLALEVISRLLLWMADAPTIEDRGLRTSVALYVVRPDLLDDTTLERIGAMTGRTKQCVHQLADSFRLTMGFNDE
jgi:hypothetical protein